MLCRLTKPVVATTVGDGGTVVAVGDEVAAGVGVGDETGGVGVREGLLVGVLVGRAVEVGVRLAARVGDGVAVRVGIIVGATVGVSVGLVAAGSNRISSR